MANRVKGNAFLRILAMIRTNMDLIAAVADDLDEVISASRTKDELMEKLERRVADHIPPPKASSARKKKV